MYSASIVILGILPPLLMFLFGGTRRWQSRLHPLIVLGWALLLGYSLKSLYLAYAVEVGAPFRTDTLSYDIIPEGQIAICVGLIAFMIGYALLARRPQFPEWQPETSYRINETGELVYHLVFGVSILLMIVYFYQMDFLTQILSQQFRAQKWYIDEEGERNSLGFLRIGGDFLVIYFLYYLTCARKLTWVNRYTLAIAFISVCYLLASSRNGVLAIIVFYLMVIGIRTSLWRGQSTVGRIAVVAAVLMLIGLTSLVRDGGREGVSGGDLSVGGGVQATAIDAFEGAYFLDPAKTAAIIDQTEQRDLYLRGQSFTAIVFAPIPRLLWSNKPAIRIGPYVSGEVLRYDNNSGIPPGGIGELYLNFGWPGILFGMVIIGGIAQITYRRYLESADERLSRPIYAIAIFVIMLFLIGDFASSILSLMRYLAAALICTIFWRSQFARDQEASASRSSDTEFEPRSRDNRGEPAFRP